MLLGDRRCNKGLFSGWNDQHRGQRPYYAPLKLPSPGGQRLCKFSFSHLGGLLRPLGSPQSEHYPPPAPPTPHFPCRSRPRSLQAPKWRTGLQGAFGVFGFSPRSPHRPTVPRTDLGLSLLSPAPSDSCCKCAAATLRLADLQRVGVGAGGCYSQALGSFLAPRPRPW